MSTKPALQKILKGILHREDENKHNHERMGIINLKRRADKSLKSNRIICPHTNPNTTKTTKWHKSPHTFQYQQ
jgi:hypothetical protein